MSEIIKENGIVVNQCEHFMNTDDAEGLHLCRVNFDNNYMSNGIPLAEKCNIHPNCYFKQLKRLEAENEEIKSLQDFYLQKIEVLQAENEHLAEKEEEAKHYLNEAYKYKQALEDIRDMAKHDCEYKCSNDCEVCKIKRCLEQRIMRKIKKVLK